MIKRTSIGIFLVALGCKSAIVESPQPASPSSPSGDKEETGDDSADKSAPITGAYLTCTITKPKTPDDVVAGCQMRSKDHRRLPDDVAKSFQFGYAPPQGKDLSAFEIRQYNLLNQGKNYYFHWALHVHAKGASLTQQTSTAFDVAGLLTPVAKKSVNNKIQVLPTMTLAQFTAVAIAQSAMPGSAYAIPALAFSAGVAAGYGAAGELVEYPALPPEEAVTIETEAPANTQYAWQPDPSSSTPQETPQVSYETLENETWPPASTEAPKQIKTDCPGAFATDETADSDCDDVLDTDDHCPYTDEALISQVEKIDAATMGCAPGEVASY